MKQQLKTKKQKQLKEGNYPFKFLLEIRDAVKPIAIKRIQIIKAAGIAIVVMLASGIIWYNFLKAPSGTELVNQMVMAAGGMDTWANIDHGTFKRTHQLYSETGEQLSERIETFYFEKSNGRVELLVNAHRPGQNPVMIGRDQEGFWALQNKVFVNAKDKARELGMMCDSKWCRPNCDMNMAFYRFSMPFKLKDPGVIAKNGGETKLSDKEYRVVNIEYEPEIGKDRWVFHINNENLITKMEYHHKTDDGKALPEEFFWSDHKEIAGLTISQKWTRYWSNGKTLEEYSFSDFDFSTNLPQEFYQRPTGLISALTEN